MAVNEISYEKEVFNFKSNGLSHLKQYTSSVSLKRRWEKTALSFAYDYSDLHSEGELDGVSKPVVIGGIEDGFVGNYRIGAETKLVESLTGRLGYRFIDGHYDFQRSDLRELSGMLQGSVFSGGLGISMDFLREGAVLDYGIEYLSIARGDWRHVISLTFKFF